ncbi:MAG: MutS-related protein, partial [Lactobacillaceae bacterium]
LIFIHQMMDGPSDRSYGVHVAQLAGLPSKVIKDAFHYLKEFEKAVAVNSMANLNYSQENLFHSEDQNNSEELISLKELAQNIQKIDLNSLTPLEALNMIANLQKEVNQLNDE